MFYAHFVLSKKGPLARIWLAAHWDKKLTRAHVFETNISSSVEAILEPKVKLALRTSGHLLLGVVRIYSRQAKYLLADCNEAFVKIKMAFRPGAEVQEDAHRDSCSLAAITLADNMHDFESALAELTEMDPYSISVNQSRPEDITMREEFGEPNLGRPDDDFGDSTFEEGGEREYGGDHSAADVMEMDEHHEAELTLTNELVRSQPSQVYAEMPPSVSMASNDEFGDMMDVDYDSGENLDRNMEEAVMFQDSTTDKIADSFSRIDSELADTTMEATIEPVDTTEPIGILACVPEEDNSVTNENIAPEEVCRGPPESPLPQVVTAVPTAAATPHAVPHSTATATIKRLPQFVLPPVTQSARIDHRRTPKRKRRLLIDEHKSIPSDVMKMQMQDTSEITTRLDLAPPTRKLMLWKETGSVDSLFSTPGRAIPSRVLQRLFYRNLKTVPVPNDSPDGLPVFRTVIKVNSVNVDEAVVAAVEQIEERAEYGGVEEVVAPGGVREEDGMRAAAAHEDDQGQHELYNITEMEEQRQSGTDQGMHPGACSSYSANYDCFVGQPTPGRANEDHEDEVQEEEARGHEADHEILSAHVSVVSGEGRPPSMYGEMPIEEARMSVALSEVMATTMSHDGLFDATFIDRSIVSNVEDHGGVSACSSDHIKLQNTMLALDNELDIIDRQFPIEMTQEGLEKRSEIMLNVLQDAMKRDNQVVFQHLTVSNNKKQAASKFYTLLLLGKQKAITLHQETPFSNIIIRPYVTG